jgi:hypothetical protein
MEHPNEAYETKIKFTDLKDFLKKDLKFATPPAELGDGEIADLMVYMRDLKSSLEAREKMLGEVLKTRHTEGLENLKKAYEESGEKAYLSIKGEVTGGLVYEYVVQQRLDTAAVEAEMGADWIEEHKKPTTFFQAKVIKG